MSELLQHYRPGLDVSSLSDEQFIYKTACLLRIREMERAGQVEEVIKKMLSS